MDRHDAKPRRPSLLAGAESQQPVPGAQPARILADMPPTPEPRRPRRSSRMRAAVVAGLGLLAVTAVGWTLLAGGEPAGADDHEVAAVTMAADPATLADPASSATLVDMAPTGPAAVSNPFEHEAAAVETRPAAGDLSGPASIVAAPAPAAVAANPFAAVEPVAHGAGTAAAPRTASTQTARPAARSAARPGTTAKPRTKAAPTAPARAKAEDADLLQTLMVNIQQPAEPARDTQGMDRLARRLDRAPMAAKAPAPAPRTEPSAPAKPVEKPAAAPAAKSTAATSSSATLRAELEQCPTGNGARANGCRRRVCRRAGVDPWACTQR